MEHALLIREGKNMILHNRPYENEKELQEVIKNSPELIQLSSVFEYPLLIIGREVDGIDVLALTVEGVPVIIECKRRQNPDMRDIIAQIFEYAARLHQKTYDEVNEIAKRYFSGDRCENDDYKNLDLNQAVLKCREIINKNEETTDGLMSEEEIIRTISDYIEQGEFYLLIVVDAISDIAFQTIEFLNSKLQKLRIEIIEVPKFQDNYGRIFIPNHVNPISRGSRQNTKAQPGKLTFDQMLKSCNPLQAKYITCFKELWEEDSEFTIEMGGKGFSAKVCNKHVVWVFSDRIQVRTHDDFTPIKDKLVRKLTEHFPGTTGKKATLREDDLKNLDNLKSFIEDIKRIINDVQDNIVTHDTQEEI